MNKQQLINDTYKHYITNKNPPGYEIDRGIGRCKYRASTGGRCAIGRILPDELYSPEIEGNSSYYLLGKEQFKQFLTIEDGESTFFTNLQSVHDRSADNRTFEFGTDEYLSLFRENLSKHLKFICDHEKLKYPGKKNDKATSNK